MRWPQLSAWAYHHPPGLVVMHVRATIVRLPFSEAGYNSLMRSELSILHGTVT